MIIDSVYTNLGTITNQILMRKVSAKQGSVKKDYACTTLRYMDLAGGCIVGMVCVKRKDEDRTTIMKFESV